MHIQCLGLSHHTADVGLREEFASMDSGFFDLVNVSGGDRPEIHEMVLLSTCNRVEIYFISDETGFSRLEQFIGQQTEISLDEIRTRMYRRIDMQVVSHLFRVAAGLDSMVLGEPQILGQVTQSYEKARDAGVVEKILSRLFQAAIHAGKRVRTETGIGKHSVSTPSIAAKLVETCHPDLSDIEILVLGAGEMAELALETLRKRGASKIHVLSRTLASACKLADRWSGDAHTMDKLLEVLPRADVLISSSSAPYTLINQEIAAEAMEHRPSRPLVIIDIAVPRDVEKDVGDLPNVHLFDIDSLNSDLDDGLKARQQEIPKVEKILDQEFLKFKKFIDSLEVVPFITQLRDHTEAIRLQELERVIRKLGGISKEQEEQISMLTHSIVNKILHRPTVELHEAVRKEDFDHYLEAARVLFGLDPSVDPDSVGRRNP